MSLALLLVVTALAATQAVWLWLDGSLFEPLQKRLREGRVHRYGIVRYLSELLTCQFCLLPWISLIVVALLLGTHDESLWRWPIYALAATRLGHSFNELMNRFGAQGDEEPLLLTDDAGDVDEPFPAASPAPPLQDADHARTIV